MWIYRHLLIHCLSLPNLAVHKNYIPHKCQNVRNARIFMHVKISASTVFANLESTKIVQNVENYLCEKNTNLQELRTWLKLIVDIGSSSTEMSTCALLIIFIFNWHWTLFDKLNVLLQGNQYSCMTIMWTLEFGKVSQAIYYLLHRYWLKWHKKCCELL